MGTAKVLARQIVDLLDVRHGRDVFVPECKGGPTWGGGHRRLDAWAMRRSYTKPCVWGYEIKISRSDFFADEKWPGYLPFCNQFYFVCPHGLLAPDEIPDGCGLLWCASTGSRLYTKRKAAHREVEVPEELFRYLLMSRTRIVPPNYYHDCLTREEWHRWLAAKADDRRMGRQIAQAIGETTRALRGRTAEAEGEALRWRKTAASYDMVRARLAELGLGLEMPIQRWELDHALQGEDQRRDVRRAVEAMEDAARMLREVMPEHGAPLQTAVTQHSALSTAREEP